MAFIDYGQSSGGGGGSITPIEGKIGLNVTQWLNSPLSDAFFNSLATLVSQTADTLRHYFNYKAPFDTLYQTMDYMAVDIYSWFQIRKPDWERILEAMTAEYNPIENYDRTREGYDAHETGTIEVDNDGSYTLDTTITSKVAPYDTETFHDEGESVEDTDQTHDDLTTTTFDKKTSVNVRDHGNVGVTTNQQMIQSEIELRKQSLVNIIVKEFIKEFCVALYN